MQNLSIVITVPHLISFQATDVLPGWTGFNIQISGDTEQAVDRIGYLPVIDAPPTDIRVVKYILDKSMKIADKLELDYIVVVVDEKIYKQIQNIRYRQNGDYIDRLVVRLGEFHTLFSYLGSICKKYRKHFSNAD